MNLRKLLVGVYELNETRCGVECNRSSEIGGTRHRLEELLVANPVNVQWYCRQCNSYANVV